MQAPTPIFGCAPLGRADRLRSSATHEKEVSLKTTHGQIAKYQKQLSESASKKEYDALQIEIAAAAARTRELEDEIAKVRREKEAAIEAQQFERAAKLRDREKELLEQSSSKEQEWRAEGVDLFNEVNEESVAEVLALWTGIPVYKLTEEETAHLPACGSDRAENPDLRSPSRHRAIPAFRRW